MKRSSTRDAATGEVVMAYILLALGALMSLVGLAAMISGYPMIEIERGWATVITGAVLFSGGLVVVALGLVVRNLVGLRSALSVVGALPASVQQPVTSAPLIPALPVAPLPFEAPAMRPPAEAFDATPALGVAVPAAAAALAAGAAHEHDERDARDVAETPHAQATPAETHDAERTVVSHPSETLMPTAYVPEIHAPEPERDRDPVEHEPAHHEPAHHETLEAHGETDQARHDGDWLDQAFSAFDHEMTMGHRHVDALDAASPEAPAQTEPSREQAKDPLANDPPEHDRPAHEPLAHEAEPDVLEHHAEHHERESHDTPAEAPATAPTEPAADLAVIGRYDSEGTSYVMYSDGSIEAQSEAGIYRFGSMAELKAFIEN